MSLFGKFSSFLVINLVNIYFNKSDAKNNIGKYFRSESSLAHSTPTLELSVNLMQVTPFCFKLNFSVEIMIELRC